VGLFEHSNDFMISSSIIRIAYLNEYLKKLKAMNNSSTDAGVFS
jgi:hypothetical protein